MRLADTLIGKDGKVISPFVNNSKIVEVVEISSSTNVAKQLDEVRKTLAKNSSATYLVVAFKQQDFSMNIIHNQNVAFRCPNTLKDKLQVYADENDLRVSAVIRNACVSYLRRDQSTPFNQLYTTSFADPRLKELAR